MQHVCIDAGLSSTMAGSTAPPARSPGRCFRIVVTGLVQVIASRRAVAARQEADIDPAEWRRDLPAGSDEAEDVVQVDEELEAEIEGDQGRELA